MTIDWAVEEFSVLPSTMDVAHERAREGAEPGLVVVAEEQSKGRGRRGNGWIGPLGNLYCSILLQPRGDLQKIGQYSFLAATALADTVKDRLKPDYLYQHKWPNDGLIDGRKFAGILLESGKYISGEYYLVMGLGVNIVSAPDDKIFLNDVFDQPVTAKNFLQNYLTNLETHLALYHDQGFAPIRSAWLRDAKGLYEDMTVRLPDETLRGVFNGLDDSGALRLGLDKGSEKVIHSGEVFFGKDI